MDEDRKPPDLAEAAFQAHYQHVYRFLLRRTGSAERAEELAQQVFADAAVALRGFRVGPPPVLALLYTLAERRFADAARRQASAPAVRGAIEDLAEVLPAVEHDELLGAALRRALGQLPDDLRLVATMKLVQGCSFAEIGRCVGVNEVACRKRFQRALEMLRTLLEQEGCDP